MAIDKQFIVEKQGRTFALLAGLLDAAHHEGLKSVETQLLQIGDESNERTWLFRASVTTDKGTFTGHGDASPANVSRNMLSVLPRMAESRALARALRFAVNAGALVAVEELGDDDIEQHPAPRPAPRPAPTPQPPTGIAPPREPTPIQGGPRPQANAAILATPAQVRAIYSIARDHHSMSETDIEERSRTLFGAPPAELTRQQASELISGIKPQQGTR